MKTRNYKVPKMACGNCFNTIRNAVSKIAGVVSVTADMEDKTVSVEYDETLTAIDAVGEKMKKIGFPPV
ncbi:MAG TPA: heavy-metal-associated domain-containing protein [Candidatus Wallbacteria bacterium]|nr:heavy-metal-associated domain-containing protein [Candidatus Wallbacteria bacterium]